MENRNEKLLDSLKHLISIAEDGKEGYQNAADDAKDANLKAMFQHYATQRAQFSTELKSLVSSMGGDPDQSSGILGGLHRAWMDIKSWLSSDDNEAVLKECVTGEKAAINAYTDALKEGTNEVQFSNLLNRQLNGIRKALVEIEREILKYDNEYKRHLDDEGMEIEPGGSFATGSHNAPYDLNDPGTSQSSEYKW